MLNLPNFLTLVRIVTIPFFLALLSSRRYLAALIVFIAGGLTDALDGALARFTNQQTALGAHLDPVADKLLVMSSFVTLGLMGGIPPWLVVLVLSRDVIILLGYATIYLLVAERMEIHPTAVGKINTIVQLVTVGFVLLDLYIPHPVIDRVVEALVLAAAATTVISGFQYIYRGLIWIQNRASSESRLG